MTKRRPKKVYWKWIPAAALFAFFAFVTIRQLWIERHDSSLLHAINAGNIQSARHAFGDGATMQMRIRRSNTFLHAAAQYTNVEMAKILVEHGAAVNEANEVGETALDIARARGHTQMTAYLQSLMTNR